MTPLHITISWQVLDISHNTNIAKESSDTCKIQPGLIPRDRGGIENDVNSSRENDPKVFGY